MDIMVRRHMKQSKQRLTIEQRGTINR